MPSSADKTQWRDLYDEVVTAIANLKPDIIRVAYTNTDPIHETIWMDRYPELSRVFAHIYISSRLGFRKPETPGFQHILDAWHVTPEQAVFFDDDRINVEAARKFGMTAVQVQKRHDVISHLKVFKMLA